MTQAYDRDILTIQLFLQVQYEYFHKAPFNIFYRRIKLLAYHFPLRRGAPFH